MRVGAVRFGRLAVAVAASGALAALCGAPAAARTGAKPGARAAQGTLAIPRQAFKVTIYPAYTTAGQSTTFEVKVANASAPGTMLQSVQLSPPPGFALSRPGPNAPLRRKTLVQRRTLSLRRISLKPGSNVQFNVIATAPKRCGKRLQRWTSTRSRARPRRGRNCRSSRRSAASASPWSARRPPRAATAARSARPTCPRRSAATASCRTRPRARCAGRSTSAGGSPAARISSTIRIGTTRS